MKEQLAERNEVISQMVTKELTMDRRVEEMQATIRDLCETNAMQLKKGKHFLFGWGLKEAFLIGSFWKSFENSRKSPNNFSFFHFQIFNFIIFQNKCAQKKISLNISKE